MLALCATVNPGDEVILFDPYFVAYPHLVTLAGGTSVVLDTYPDFRIDVDRVRGRRSRRRRRPSCFRARPTRPGSTTRRGHAARPGGPGPREGRAADRRRDLPVVLVRRAVPVGGRVRPERAGRGRVRQDVRHHRLAARVRPRAEAADRGNGQAATVHVRLRRRARSSTPGWRPWTWTCRPSWRTTGGKRDFVCDGPRRASSSWCGRAGRFTCSRRCRGAPGPQFVEEAIRHNLLVIPGIAFGRKDTHFRVSYAAADEKLRQGAEILNRLACR